MKTPISLLAALLALGTSGQLVAQDSNAPKTEKPATTADTTTTSTNAAPSLPFELPPVETNQIGTAGLTLSSTAISFSDLGISTNAVVISSMSNRLDVLESGRIQLSGSLVPVVKKPSLVTFLQLFNPFAPAEYGGMEITSASQGFGRVFADPVKTGPTTVLFSVGDNPPKASTTTSAR